MRPSLSQLVASLVFALPTLAYSCKTGKKLTVKDTFSKARTDLWTMEAGWPDQVKYDKSTGMTMTLSQKRDNIVFASKHLWTPPVSFTVDMQATQAPGVVSAVTWRGYKDPADEIDLEFVGGWPLSLQTVTWSHAQRESWNTADAPNGVNPTTAFHKYKLAWASNGTVSVSVDGHVVRQHIPRPGQAWPQDAMPVRFGPWAATNLQGWAGTLNWAANKYPKMKVKSLTITGCAS